MNREPWISPVVIGFHTFGDAPPDFVIPVYITMHDPYTPPHTFIVTR